jgi:lipopolysaccharide/colanic/teichoic acid biosynthesis glycosyltransferase
MNMLKGDMSLIGSRPLKVRNLSYYTEKENISF